MITSDVLFTNLNQTCAMQVMLGTRRLHQRIEELKGASSSISQYFLVKHSSAPKDLEKNFSILKKCKSKFDCLVFEMFFIYELRPSLHVQSDSIRAKVFK